MKIELIATESDIDKRIDAFVSENTEMSRSQVKKIMEENKISHNGKVPKVSQKIKDQDIILVEIDEAVEIDILGEDIDFEIVYEDEYFAIINKPQGLVVHPTAHQRTGTLVNGLINRLSNLSGINGVLRPGIVHRIDKDTSGLLMVAKNDLAHQHLAKQIETKMAKRIYIALCEGTFKEKSGRIATKIGRSRGDRKKMAVIFDGKDAVTNYEVLFEFEKFSLVKFALETGRTHQIRVHAKHIGHPVVGDPSYGFQKQKFKLSGQLLHAIKLTLVHPKTEEETSFYAPVNGEFERIVNLLNDEEQKGFSFEEIRKYI